MEASPQTDSGWSLPARPHPQAESREGWRLSCPPSTHPGSLDEALPELHGQEFWSPQRTYLHWAGGWAEGWGILGGGGQGLARAWAFVCVGDRGWPQGPQER